MTHNKFIRLTSANYHSAYKIHVGAQFSPWSEAIFCDCLSGQYAGFSLEQDNILIGYYMSLFVLDEVTLMDISVAADSRGKGNARVLIEHLIAQCRAKNITGIWLEVRQSNSVAIELYESSGFVLVEHRKDYYPSAQGHEDAMIMTLTLAETQ
jgi:ribosomal-protein-alanine N-acetyltransferase